MTVFISCTEVRDAKASGDRDAWQRSSQQAGVHAKAVWAGETSGVAASLKTTNVVSET